MGAQCRHVFTGKGKVVQALPCENKQKASQCFMLRVRLDPGVFIMFQAGRLGPSHSFSYSK